MDDLISRKALIQSINTQILGMSGFAREIRHELIEIINSQPTAYDVDKVVQKIEEKQKQCNAGLYTTEYEAFEESIMIVKEGAAKE